jgi:5'-nucleotidase
MRILLSNDDGYRAQGLVELAECLGRVAEVTVVAPERNRSGASNSLTLDRPLRVSEIRRNYFAVDGTPADCVNLALTGMLETRPDLVIAGINAGENLGEDVLYSGTVAAAMEGALLGYPALATSLASREDRPDYAAAAAIILQLVMRFKASMLDPGQLLNVNIPGRGEIQGTLVTRLGRRHKDTTSVRQLDPKNRPIYWIGPTGSPGFDAGPGTDFHALANDYVSVTPIQTDMTAYTQLERTTAWLNTNDHSS